jgi:hypothetical protein
MAERANQPGQQQTPIQAQPIVIHPDQMAILQECMLQMAATNERILENAAGKREKLVTDIVRRTTDCDGSSYRPLKNWFQEVEYTLNYSNNNSDLLEVAVKTARGELRKEIETFLTEYSAANIDLPRFQTPWKDLKQHLFATFIPLDEQDELREKVNKLTQAPSESIAAFNRRFKTIADEAYPAPLRNADQQQILLKAYLRSLSNIQIKRPIVHSEPQTLEAAMFKAVQTEQFEKKLTTLEPTVEPMDISAVQNTLVESDISKMIDEKLAAMSISAIHNTPQNLTRHRQTHPRQTGKNTRITNSLAWTQDGRPICYECGKPNHIARQCLKRNSRIQTQTQSTNAFTGRKPPNQMYSHDTTGRFDWAKNRQQNPTHNDSHRAYHLNERSHLNY